MKYCKDCRCHLEYETIAISGKPCVCHACLMNMMSFVTGKFDISLFDNYKPSRLFPSLYCETERNNIMTHEGCGFDAKHFIPLSEREFDDDEIKRKIADSLKKLDAEEQEKYERERQSR